MASPVSSVSVRVEAFGTTVDFSILYASIEMSICHSREQECFRI